MDIHPPPQAPGADLDLEILWEDPDVDECTIRIPASELEQLVRVAAGIVEEVEP